MRAALRGVRSRADLEEALTKLLGRALELAATREVPYLTDPRVARTVVALAAGSAGLIEEASEATAVFSVGTTAVPAAAAATVATAAAAIVELYVAGMVRAAQLRAAGITPTSERLGKAMITALTGRVRVSSDTTSVIVRALLARVARRLAFGVAPVVGAFADGFDAQRTIGKIMRVPLDVGVDR